MGDVRALIGCAGKIAVGLISYILERIAEKLFAQKSAAFLGCISGSIVNH